MLWIRHPFVKDYHCPTNVLLGITFLFDPHQFCSSSRIYWTQVIHPTPKVCSSDSQSHSTLTALFWSTAHDIWWTTLWSIYMTWQPRFWVSVVGDPFSNPPLSVPYRHFEGRRYRGILNSSLLSGVKPQLVTLFYTTTTWFWAFQWTRHYDVLKHVIFSVNMSACI